MTKYFYTATDRHGKSVQGQIEAENLETLRTQLQNEGLFLTFSRPQTLGASTPNPTGHRPGIIGRLVRWQAKFDELVLALHAQTDTADGLADAADTPRTAAPSRPRLPRWLIDPRVVHALEALFFFYLLIDIAHLGVSATAHWRAPTASGIVAPTEILHDMLQNQKFSVVPMPADTPLQTESIPIRNVPMDMARDATLLIMRTKGLPGEVTASNDTNALCVTTSTPTLANIYPIVAALDQPLSQSKSSMQALEMFTRVNRYIQQNK